MKQLSCLDRFFFQYENEIGASLFRIIFCATLLMNLFLRVPYSEIYYTDLSGIPGASALELLPKFFQPAFQIYPTTLLQVYFFEGIQAFALIGLLLGVGGQVLIRIWALIALVTHIGLMQRNFSILYGADIVATFWLIGLCFMDSGKHFSLRTWLQNKKPSSVSHDLLWSKTLSSAGLRMCQIQLCIIYGYTGFEKLKGNDWWDQTALWKVLGNEQIMIGDYSFMRSAPLVIGLLTWATVLFEIYFPALIWQKATKKWMILAGWLLHLGIAMTMGIFIFSFTMMVSYLLFMNRDEIERLFRPLKILRFDRPLSLHHKLQK